jgi:phosphoglycolate phosphatase
VTDARELLKSARAVLLDFDGPVTPLMPAPANMHAADVGRAALAAHGFNPAEIRTTTDHLAVIRWAGSHAHAALADVEAACGKAEVEAARVCTPTPGAHDLLSTLDSNGTPTVIVTNNAADAVLAYLERWNLVDRVRDVVGRPELRPDLMKPNTYTVDRALQALGMRPGTTVLIGDSVSDIVVARKAGVLAIGYAKTPKRGAELRAAGSDAITDSISNLVADAG